jgi:UDP-N-acetylglucosamine 2-epimerase (non-hydrolysing)
MLLVLGDTQQLFMCDSSQETPHSIFHMEAGNRCLTKGFQRKPIKIVDHVSDVNLTYSDIAREYLLREVGLPADRIINKKT